MAGLIEIYDMPMSAPRLAMESDFSDEYNRQINRQSQLFNTLLGAKADVAYGKTGVGAPMPKQQDSGLLDVFTKFGQAIGKEFSKKYG